MAIEGSRELRAELAQVKKGEVRSVYLIFGTEGYLVRTASEKLVEAVAEATGAEVVRLDAAGKPPEAVLQPVTTLSLFASSRCVVVRGFTHLLTGDEADRLLAGLDSGIGPGSTVVFVAPADSADRVDKRVKGFKGLAKRGLVLELDRQKPDDLLAWLREQAAQEGKELSAGAARLLLDRAGPEMQMLRMELDKALLYCLDRDRIDASDLEGLVGKSREEAVWSVAEAVAEGNPARAMSLLADLVAAGAYPLVILTLLVRQVRHVLQARLLWEDAGSPPFRSPEAFRTRVQPAVRPGAFGGGADDVTTIHPFAAFKRFEAAQSREVEELCASLSRLAAADRDTKTGAGAGPEEALEEVILDLCARARPARGRAA
ncbi:MAG: DNA polymerase III subunit delta [Candidatus Eiseniibacteriota bacterium]